MMRPRKVLLGHLASYGDALFATAVARQIKHDIPECHLTWAIGSLYRPAIEGNPYVDEIWEIPLARRDDADAAWRRFAAEARVRVKRGEFDEAYYTQIGPDNYQNFDGTIRASVFRGYPRSITVPITPVIRLSEAETEATKAFAEHHRLRDRTHVILFECAAASRQSFVTPEYASVVARLVTHERDDIAVILSSTTPVEETPGIIIDGSTITFRQNAELTRYCTLLVGCSSGVSWLSTSDWAKPLPTIQLLRRATSVFASMAHDAAYFGLPTSHIIELTDCTVDRVAACILAAVGGPFEEARERFHEEIPVRLDYYFDVFMRAVLRQMQPLKIVRSMTHVFRRYGTRPFLRYGIDRFRGVIGA
ncbi:MAG: hypothetical protein AB1428_10190 [Bacteroidota bacterium]